MSNLTYRHQYIVQQLASHGRVAVDQLAKVLDTSEVTIRKDLAQLEQRGDLVRRYGGAVRVEQRPQPDRSVVNHGVSKRKSKLAACAIDLVPDGARIIIDGGSTVRALVPLLNQKRDLLVMTNSPSAAVALTELDSEPKVLMTGGTWDSVSHSLQGHMAEKMLAEYDFDIAFVGASGLDVHRGTTTYNELTRLTNVMAQTSATVVVMSTSDKLKKKMPNLELDWQNIDVLITDEDIDPSSKQLISDNGVRVIAAEMTKE